MDRDSIAVGLRAKSVYPYDLLVCSLGYESRARFVAETAGLEASRKIAIGFKDRRVLSYKKNREWFGRRGFEVLEPEEGSHFGLCRDVFESVLVGTRELSELKIGIDVSSMTRSRIADWALVLRAASFVQRLWVDFYYSVAAFSAPPKIQPANVYVGPLAPETAGWTLEPERPVVAVVGLGHEEDKALGAIEHLQAGQVFVFIPSSAIKEYDKTVMSANRLLFDVFPAMGRSIYSVEKPETLFVRLESLVSGLKSDSSPVILPFGPKIFTVVSMLVGLVHRDVAIWRVSGNELEVPCQRHPSGIVVQLSVDFAPPGAGSA